METLSTYTLSDVAGHGISTCRWRRFSALLPLDSVCDTGCASSASLSSTEKSYSVMQVHVSSPLMHMDE